MVLASELWVVCFVKIKADGVAYHSHIHKAIAGQLLTIDPNLARQNTVDETAMQRGHGWFGSLE